MEQTYRLEFNEEQQFFNLHDGTYEENTHGWFTILKNCTVSDFEVYERYINCVKQKKLTKKYLLKCASELKGFGNGLAMLSAIDHIDLLNQRIEALSIADVSDLCCASCGYQMKFDKGEDKWGCTKCGYTS